MGQFLGRCGDLHQADPDFRVIARGLWDGAMSRHPVSIDKRIFSARASQALVELGLNEKAVMTDAEVQAWMRPGAIEELVQLPLPMPGQALKRRDRIRAIVAEFGLARGAGVIAGRLLTNIGGRLERLARRE
jgi:hypothetical protein